MRKVILYIAQSMDGKIAKADGDVAWLESIPPPEGEDFGYANFYNSIDTVLMGNNTFRQILNFDVEYPYADKQNVVFTSNPLLKETNEAKFVSGDIASFVRELKDQKGENIWLVGGAQINSMLLKEGLIDEIMLFTMPVVIGKGITLFADCDMEKQFNLADYKSYSNGTTMALYRALVE